MYFESRVDWWYYALMVVLAVVVFAAVGTQARKGRVSIISSVVLVAIALVVPLWLLLGTQYLVDDETLFIRSGPKSWEIPLDQIEGVSRSRSSRSSPALSFDRLEIRYDNGKSVLVSPKDEDQFLEAVVGKRLSEGQ